MPTIKVRLDPRKLDNPDADLRYALPDLIQEESFGEVKDDGYDYVGDRGLLWVLSVLEHDTTFGNTFLLAAVVAVERDGQKIVGYPKNYNGGFPI
jgi:hypothetical protein